MSAQALLVGHIANHTGTVRAVLWFTVHVFCRAILPDINRSGFGTYGCRMAGVSDCVLDTIVPISYGPSARASSQPYQWAAADDGDTRVRIRLGGIH